MGNNGEIFTNDAGQSVPNPEGYATMSEINLTREIFSELALIFPERFITKDNTNVPESFKLFKDKKKPIYQLKIDPNLEYLEAKKGLISQFLTILIIVLLYHKNNNCYIFKIYN